MHAASNAAATTVYLASWAAPERGHHELGICRLRPSHEDHPAGTYLAGW
ncbi:UNVERIFIED_ORG: hypothetical protein J2X79_003625 [Arthrobacter globiformis]|nr:hypothetical protein [Arthrobacter globiformis]